MVKRYSGHVTVNVTWNEKENQYNTRVSAPGYSPLKLNVEVSAALESPVKSPEAYDRAARAAIMLAEGEFWGAGMAEFAAYRLERLHVGRTPEKKNPEPMSTAELNRLSKDELMKVWSYIHRHPIRAARELFPKRPPKYVTATRNYGAYASNRAAMLGCKERNDEPGTEVYQFICDRLKDSLPLWAD